MDLNVKVRVPLYSQVLWLVQFLAHIMSLDIDECSLDQDDCFSEALCININGSYNCTCQYGFFGNGTFCEGNN